MTEVTRLRGVIGALETKRLNLRENPEANKGALRQLDRDISKLYGKLAQAQAAAEAAKGAARRERDRAARAAKPPNPRSKKPRGFGG